MAIKSVYILKFETLIFKRSITLTADLTLFLKLNELF